MLLFTPSDPIPASESVDLCSWEGGSNEGRTHLAKHFMTSEAEKRAKRRERKKTHRNKGVRVHLNSYKKDI